MFNVRFNDGDTKVISRGDEISVSDGLVTIKEDSKIVAVLAWGSLSMVEQHLDEDCCVKETC